MPYVALVPIDPTVSGVEWTRGDGSDVTIVRPSAGAGASTGFIVLDTDAPAWVAEAATHGFALTSVSVAGTSPSPLPVPVLTSGPQTLSPAQQAQAQINLGLPSSYVAQPTTPAAGVLTRDSGGVLTWAPAGSNNTVGPVITS